MYIHLSATQFVYKTQTVSITQLLLCGKVWEPHTLWVGGGKGGYECYIMWYTYRLGEAGRPRQAMLSQAKPG